VVLQASHRGPDRSIRADDSHREARDGVLGPKGLQSLRDLLKLELLPAVFWPAVPTQALMMSATIGRDFVRMRTLCILQG
jgi:hypothetical protein